MSMAREIVMLKNDVLKLSNNMVHAVTIQSQYGTCLSTF